MSIKKIVITGGPCGGKTTGISWINDAFKKKGYTLLFISETATELITGGVAPWTCVSNIAFQRCQVRLQIEKEKIFENAARHMKSEKVLIVCDRGAFDNKAYMTDAQFEKIIHSMKETEAELRDWYDAVFHLETAAKGAEEFYTTSNNSARTETVEEAIALDDKIIKAWEGHNYFKIIGNEGSFEDKMNKLINEIEDFIES